MSNRHQLNAWRWWCVLTQLATQSVEARLAGARPELVVEDPSILAHKWAAEVLRGELWLQARVRAAATLLLVAILDATRAVSVLSAEPQALGRRHTAEASCEEDEEDGEKREAVGGHGRTLDCRAGVPWPLICPLTQIVYLHKYLFSEAKNQSQRRIKSNLRRRCKNVGGAAAK